MIRITLALMTICTIVAGLLHATVPPIPPVIVIPTKAATEPAPPVEETKDISQLTDRIEKNVKQLTAKLEDRDTGDATLKDQTNLKKDLDQLIDLLQNQPPPPMSQSSSQQPPPPSGGGSGSQKQPPPPMGGNNKPPQKPMGGTPPPMGQQQPSGGQPMPMPMPMGGTDSKNPQPAKGTPQTDPKGGNTAGQAGSSTPSLPLAETIAKDFWGHLPELPRQRMMQFYREQYNSRYKNLLPDYFSTLAEKEKKGKK